jgi:hypothetical protein
LCINQYGEIIVVVFMLEFVEQSTKCQKLCSTDQERQDLQNSPMTDQVSLMTYKRYCPYIVSEVQVGNSEA